LPGLLAFVAGKRLLLILDSCEHVIEAAAGLAERLFNHAPRLHILTTSQEPLRAEGEHVHLLLPLDYPAAGLDLTAAQALTWPAVQLFVERAAAGGYRFELTDRDAPVVAGICRRLDGLTLAIELAAGRAGAYGIDGTAELLDNRFKLLWQGRRSALPRHQTMHAMLDWSYNLLSVRDRRVLCRLSIFAGVFTLHAAQDVAADTEVTALDVADALASLIDKSLIATSAFAGSTYHRLLDSTRTYAALKLAESGEENEAARRHALYYSETLTSETIGTSIFGGQGLSAYTPFIGDIRAALEWSFSSRGENPIAVQLAARSAPLFLGLSILSECRRWCQQGLAALAEADRGTAKELTLQEALAISAMFTQGNGQQIRSAIERGLSLAEALGNEEHQLHLLAGLHIFLTRIGDFHGALEVAERSAAIAVKVSDLGAAAMTDWMLGTAYHLVGNQEGAQRHCELGLKRAAASGPIQIDFFGYDHRVRALIVLARVLWLRGFPDQAARAASQAIDAGERRNHPVTLCISLIYTITVSLWSGDLETAGERIERLIMQAAKHSLGPYRAVGQALRGELAIASGQAATGVALLRDALAALYAEQHHVLATGLSCALAEGLAQVGQVEEALATIDGILARMEERGETFEVPRLLRARGEILLGQPHPDLGAAEETLLSSLDRAHAQSALSWELRAAIPLARLWQSQSRGAQAREMLAGVFQRFTEGFDTADLKAASSLLDELEHSCPENKALPQNL
jgi:predicted ATPase